MKSTKLFNEIPITDMLWVTTLADPSKKNVAKALPDRPEHEIAAISAILHGRMAEFEQLTTQKAPTTDVMPVVQPTNEPGVSTHGAKTDAPSVREEASVDTRSTLSAESPESSFPLPDLPPASEKSDQFNGQLGSPEPVAEPEEDWDSQIAAAIEAKLHKQRTVDPKDFVKSLNPAVLAPYAWGASDKSVGHLKVELEEKAETKQAFLQWEPVVTDKPIVIYRVIGADAEQKRSPEKGDTLVFTKGTAFRDELNPTTGMRHYMVWAYIADAVKDIIEVQPVLVGEYGLALPPVDFKIAETGGVVTGTWTPLTGHSNVLAFVRPQGAAQPLDSPIHQIRVGVDARSFSYTAPVRGVTYEFQIFPEILFNEDPTRGAGSQVETHTVSADIEAVKLQTVLPMTEDGKDIIVVNWKAPPTGDVKIYLTQSEPAPGLIGQVVDNNYIDDDDALGSTQWITTVQSDPGEEVHRKLIWPADWWQVFCVPVNVVGGKSLVGDYHAISRVEPITEYSLVQRGDSQLITFDWPGGAQLVEVACRQGKPWELIEEDYRRQGGIRLNLNAYGDEVTLTPKSIYAGDTTTAEATIIEYPGLKVYAYKIDRLEHELGFGVLWIWRDGTEDRRPPQFMLVHNPERFPLYPDDGEKVQLAKNLEQSYSEPAPLTVSDYLPGSQADARAKGQCWAIDFRGLTTGYLRLFMQPTDQDREKPGSRIVIDDETIVDLRI